MNTKELIHIADSRLLKVTNRPETVMSNGHGMYLTDLAGNEYLDFIGGWAVNCIGHSPKIIQDVLTEQSGTLINASPSFYNVPMLEYAELLIDNCCLDRVFFASTGAEANEGAIKLARKYGQLHKNGASEIITTHNGFHGRTLAMMSATGKAHWEDLFEPKVQGFKKAIFNDYDSICELVNEQTCGIMIELIQGEGGVNVADTDYVRKLRELCDAKGILLIFDEIQTGFGRTGKLFCYEHYNIEPDILTLGKGIGGGFPISALLAKEKLNIFDPGDQGGTYTAQPLGMAVGLAVLKKLLEDKIVENCSRMGALLKETLLGLSQQYEIDNIRGKGLLLAFNLTRGNAANFANKCMQDGLLINSPREASIRLMPPLIVKEAEIEKFRVLLKNNLSEKE